MDKEIQTSKPLRGELRVPGDKSISHRSVMIGAISQGTTEITGFLNAADPLSTVSCFQSLGVKHEIDGEAIHIHGKGLRGLRQSPGPLDAGNSGTTMRLMAGILAGQAFSSTLIGDRYLMQRPMKRIIDPLAKMGATISASDRFTAPLTIQPADRLTAIDHTMTIASAQVKSAILFAGLYADGITRVIENEPSRDHTERMLHLTSENADGKSVISVEGGKELQAASFLIPGDPSSAAFFVVAALIVPGSEIKIESVGLNPTRTGFLSVLQKMGGNITIENERIVGGEPIGDLVVRSSELRTDIELQGDIIPNIIDEIPILSVAALFASGSFTVKDAGDLRHKETDRITAVCTNLRSAGVDVTETPDGFAFQSKNNLLESVFDSFDDHRIAMAFGTAALAINGTSTVRNAECVSISFPDFWQTIQSLQQ